MKMRLLKIEVGLMKIMC